MLRPRYRGYIHSNMLERSVPQSIQQQVIRAYCERLGLEFMLSATEYTIPGCTVMLETALRELSVIDGICAYSIWALPEDKAKRMAVYKTVIDANKVMLFAAENISIRTKVDVGKLEDIFMVRAICAK